MPTYDNNFFTQKAINEGKRARSYYKLQELDKKFNLFPKKISLSILDLGCFPGSWCQYILENINKSIVIGIDLKKTQAFLPSKINNNQVHLIQKDIKEIDKILPTLIYTNSFDLIVSDLSPKTTGIMEADSYNSYLLMLQLTNIVDKWLKPQGMWVGKYFEGGESQELIKFLRSKNCFLKLFKPKSSKKKSVEVFLVGRKKTG